VRVCLAAFDNAADRWADPAWWLTDRRQRSYRPWSIFGEELRLFRALIAAHLGKFRVAEAALSKLIASKDPPRFLEWYESLLRMVRERAN